MRREIALGSLFLLVTGLALWAVSQPTGGLRPGAGILGRPVGVTSAYWEPGHPRATPVGSTEP
jgi:hypothetical protein